MISPSISFAILIAKEDLPVAVGPDNKINFLVISVII